VKKGFTFQPEEGDIHKKERGKLPGNNNIGTESDGWGKGRERGRNLPFGQRGGGGKMLGASGRG